MTTEFDKVFDQMEAPEYPATCDNCGEVGTNASIEQHECGNEQPRPEQAGGGTTSETVPCELCSALTRMKSTKRCDRCWELEHRIQDSPELARKILAAIEHTDAPAAPERGEHSPLPWSIEDGPSGYADESADSHYTIIAADSFSIAVMVNDCVPPERGNAELIVRAVNLHSTLVAQRERLLEALRDVGIRLHGVQLHASVGTENAYDLASDLRGIRDEILSVLTTIEQEGTR